jgi:SAM-dependent methyltransferase
MSRAGDRPLMYGELASWWPLLSASADYADEASYYLSVLGESCVSPPRTLLELGSGGGNNASHMKRHFEHVTLVDLSPEMLAVSERLNPECEHHVGDMRSVRLGRLFDCVFVHDAICYATTQGDMEAVIETAYAHCAPGGAALLAPDFVQETFRASTHQGGHDGDDGRGLRFVEWVWDPDPADATYRVEYAILLREPHGEVRVRHDRHLEGLFPIETWVAALQRSGFEPHVREHRHVGESHEYVVFVGTRDRNQPGTAKRTEAGPCA